MSFIAVKKDGELALVTINREKALNALNAEVLAELKAAWQDLENSKVRLAIVTGAGTKAFVAGADISSMASFTPDQALEFARLGHSTMSAIADSPVISIAAINGFALGGGMELALSCTLRVAAESARLGLPEVGLGIIPGFGGTQRLSRLVGPAKALKVILSGQMYGAQEALAAGFIEEIAPDSDLLNRCQALAASILDSRSPLAQAVALKTVRHGLDLSLKEGLELEQKAFSELFAGDQPRRGMEAFLEKRKPDFS
jgi:enoyl-CoA hydratase